MGVSVVWIDPGSHGKNANRGNEHLTQWHCPLGQSKSRSIDPIGLSTESKNRDSGVDPCVLFATSKGEQLGENKKRRKYANSHLEQLDEVHDYSELGLSKVRKWQ